MLSDNSELNHVIVGHIIPQAREFQPIILYYNSHRYNFVEFKGIWLICIVRLWRNWNVPLKTKDTAGGGPVDCALA